MSTQTSNRRSAFLAAAVCVVSFVMGGGALIATRPDSSSHTAAAASKRNPPAVSGPVPSAAVSALSRQSEILGLLKDHYYRSVDVQALAAVPLVKLPVVLQDPYTSYLSPAALVEFNRGDTGTYTGVGVRVKLVEHEVVLDGVAAGGPAAVAGLRVGDVLVSVGGRSLHGVDVEVGLKWVRGRVGTSVTLGLRRGSRSLTVVVRRAEVPARVVFHEVRKVSGRKVGYIQVSEFSQEVGEAVRAAARDFTAQGRVSEIVLDLRGNSGGLVSQALELTSVFTAAGSPVFVESGEHIDRTVFRTRTAPVDVVTPLGVLVDADSASAAEIVTGALRDNGRAMVFGAKTFGKGVIQQMAPLQGGGALKYTMAEYLTPSGHRVNHQGITPDVVVATDRHHGNGGGTDRAFEAAARTLRHGH
jgi:carboxyl-terminal processing protease